MKIILTFIALYILGIFIMNKVLDLDIHEIFPKKKESETWTEYLVMVIVFPIIVAVICVLLLLSILFWFGLHPLNWL
jgi:hypothetical protein